MAQQEVTRQHRSSNLRWCGAANYISFDKQSLPRECIVRHDADSVQLCFSCLVAINIRCILNQGPSDLTSFDVGPMSA